MLEIQPIIGKNFAKIVIPLIKQTKKTIDILVYDWQWYPNEPGTNIQKFNNSIVNLAEQKKQIRVITNTKKTIFILNNHKIKTKKIYSKRLVHAKIMIIDNEKIILGSHNYTKNAFNINHEVSVILTNNNDLQTFIDFFNRLWGKYNQPI